MGPLPAPQCTLTVSAAAAATHTVLSPFMYNLTLDPSPEPHEVDWQTSTLLLLINKAEFISSVSGQVGH